jgi:hypothetical protein
VILAEAVLIPSALLWGRTQRLFLQVVSSLQEKRTADLLFCKFDEPLLESAATADTNRHFTLSGWEITIFTKAIAWYREGAVPDSARISYRAPKGKSN